MSRSSDFLGLAVEKYTHITGGALRSSRTQNKFFREKMARGRDFRGGRVTVYRYTGARVTVYRYTVYRVTVRQKKKWSEDGISGGRC